MGGVGCQGGWSEEEQIFVQNYYIFCLLTWHYMTSLLQSVIAGANGFKYSLEGELYWFVIFFPLFDENKRFVRINNLVNEVQWSFEAKTGCTIVWVFVSTWVPCSSPGERCKRCLWRGWCGREWLGHRWAGCLWTPGSHSPRCHYRPGDHLPAAGHKRHSDFTA